ncbi:rhomboid family intramembrane serine protease [Halosolutus amylolyticus]|uniref:Rhomboid family intramembrane serine protease n=1 Tax=Halosolutus amylolyticus TaxID=2932267 RepID=A0ABD5PMJ2_9EURY|nr:rhomboid family intramembrane serine protease [Halosolutus amylolyticus]
MLSIATAIAVVVVVSLLVSIAIVRRIHRAGPRWGDVVRERLVMGVPWGTFVAIAVVFSVYLFVQDGTTDFQDPVTIPFRSWSYFYPLGMVTAALSHAGPGHLLGNLFGTVVVAPIAEYAWGHYPDERGSQTFASWRTNPWLRALVIFPAIVVAVALLTSVFALGPVIGFSGVVFAFAGFAIVHYPIVTIVATLGVQGVLVTIYRALQSPIAVYVAEPRPPSPPSWATIAIQGHALGFFVGLVLGVLVLRRRDRRPDVARIWLAVLLYGFSSSLWAIYWFGGENTYILLRGPGVVVVTILTLVVTLAVAGPETSLVPRLLDRVVARVRGSTGRAPADRALELGCRATDGTRGIVDRPDRIRTLASAGGHGTDESRLADVTSRDTAFMAVLVVFAVLAGIAVPANLLVLEETSAASNPGVEIEDYTVTYAEGVENELVTAIEIGPFQDDVQLDSSGVIVVSEERQLWLEAVSAQRLAFTGEETIHVGGPGWRETVHVDRTGWETIGNDTVYQVWLWEDGGDHRLAYESNASRADVRIADRNVTIASEDGEFRLDVDSNGTTSTAQVPADNETTTAGGLTFERDGKTIYASADGTEVAIAREERYN